MIFYSIYDNLGEKYYTPVLMVNDNTALRFFRDLVNDKEQKEIYNNPQDYSLWKVAEFDERHGSVIPALKKITDATSLKKED